VHRVRQFIHCNATLEDVEATHLEKRQVFDRLKVQLKSLNTKPKPNAAPLREKNQANFLLGVIQPVQYGPEIKSQVVYFNQYHHVPLERTAEIIEGLYEHSLAEATIVQAYQKAAEQVVPGDKAIKNILLSRDQ
jgi:transposase